MVGLEVCSSLRSVRLSTATDVLASTWSRTLLGDPAKAKTKLGWSPRISFEELVAEMVREDFKSAERDELVKHHGYKVMTYHE